MAHDPLIGAEEATVDEKGRVRLSKKKQDRLGNNFVAWLDPIGCIALYPKTVWQEKIHELLSLPPSSVEREMALRDLGSNAVDEMNCDPQGRFVIPIRYRNELNLNGDVVIAGCVDRCELWQKEEFEKFLVAKKEHAKTRRELAERGTM